MTRRPAARWAIAGGLVTAFVLVPFVLLGDDLDSAVLPWLRAAPAVPFAAATGALLAADVVLPVPSSVLGVAAGARLGAVTGALVGAAGLQLGCALAWALGRGAGEPLLRRLVGQDERQRAQAWLSAPRGTLFLAACRPVPMLAEATVLMAGSVRMPWGRFTAVTAAANLGIAAYYAGMGALAVEQESLALAVVGAAALPAASMLAFRRWKT